MLGWLAAIVIAILLVTVITEAVIIKKLRQMLKELRLQIYSAKINKIYRKGDFHEVEVGIYSGKRFLFFPKKVAKLTVQGQKLDPALRVGQKLMSRV